LRAATACFTVIPAMIFMAYTMSTLIHGTPGVGSTSCWPQNELRQRTDDAANGV
jgi:hypothetical protein